MNEKEIEEKILAILQKWSSKHEDIQSDRPTCRFWCSRSASSAICEIIEVFKQALAKQRKEILETPMGTSQWKNHGKKYSYWKFFEKKLREEIIEVAEGMRRKVPYVFRTMADIDAHRKEAEVYDRDRGYNKALTDFIKAIDKELNQ